MKRILSAALALAMVLCLSVSAFAADPKHTWGTGITADDTEGDVKTAWDGLTEVSQDITVPAAFNDDDFDATKVEANYFVVLTWNVESTLTYTIQSSDFTWHVYDALADGEDSQSADFSGTAAAAGYEGDGKWTGTATVNVTMQNWSNRPVKGVFSYADMTAANSTDGYVKKDIVTDDARTLHDPITLASAADGVEVYEDASAGNYVDSGDVTALTIDADSGTMTGAISDSDAVIGTLTVTIRNNSSASSASEP